MFLPILIFLLPLRVVLIIFPTLRLRIQPETRIGFSWINVSRLVMESGSRIGNFNFIQCNRLYLKSQSSIHSGNIIRGPFSVLLNLKSQIGNRNIISRSPRGSSWGVSLLKVGRNSKITAAHKIDCTKSVFIGDNSIVAGLSSQLWTHGYFHESDGGRFRVDGKIVIGNNVYVGSASIINAGVSIASNITIGSHSSVSKNLLVAGLYVSSPLRFINRSKQDLMDKLSPVDGFNLCERVYIRK